MQVTSELEGGWSVAEDFDFNDLGDLGDLYKEENLIDLLYNVQESQNKNDEESAASGDDTNGG